MKVIKRIEDQETETITYRSRRNDKDEDGNMIRNQYNRPKQTRIQENRERVVNRQVMMLIEHSGKQEWMSRTEAKDRFDPTHIDELEKEYLLKTQGHFMVGQGVKKKKVTAAQETKDNQ